MIFSESELIEIRRSLHKIPEIGMVEFETSDFLGKQIEQIVAGHKNISVKHWRTGFLVTIKGKNSRKLIAWRTDIDGLPVTEKTGLPFSSEHTGRMHACGHDIHMTVALGLLAQAVEKEHENDLLFLFQPAEENAFGAKVMFEDGAFDPLPDEIYALHVNPDLPTGIIATNSQTLFAGTYEVILTFTGQGGHAAFPHEANDMVIAASNFIIQAQTIISRNINPLESAVITFGSMQAGTTNNVIAKEAKLFGTVRFLNLETMEQTKKRIKAIAAGIALSFGCEYALEIIEGGYLPVVNHPELATKFIEFVKTKNCFQSIGPLMTGEDFGFLLNQVPGVMFWLGVNSPRPLHDEGMNPDEAAIYPTVQTISEWLDLRAN